MAKVTGKYQVTLPKAVVDRCGIKIGDELEFEIHGQAIYVRRADTKLSGSVRQSRLALFDRSIERQMKRQRARPLPPATSRGWKREDLYARGRTR